MPPTPAPLRLPLRRLALLGAMFLSSLLSCGREITGPENGIGVRYAHGLSFITEFPESFASAVEQGAGSVVSFTRVRVLFVRMDSTVALDRVIEFPENASELAINFSVPLSSSAPASGEPMQLYLRYLNAAGDTVFSGGPVDVLAVPSNRTSSTQPEPVNVPVVYTGPGAEATTVSITPDTVFVNAGEAFAFSAIARDAQLVEVTDAPLVWSSLNPTMATLGSIAAGTGTTLPSRGAARVRVALAAGGLGSGWADTAVVMIAPVPSALTLISGGNQTGSVLAPLADSILVRLTATDGLPLANVPVRFAVTGGGGSLSVDSVLTDLAGHASTRWTLGNSVGAQAMTATVAGLTPVQVSATGESGAGIIVATNISPTPDTLTFIGQSAVLTAISTDATLDTVGGSYTWLSLDDSIATMSVTGEVTAVQNGTARVVVTEAGGTADTATLVVAQAVSSVTITPGNRELYLGGSFAFSAQAVDGGGTPMAVQPPVNWSVQNEAIASVDSLGLVTSTGLGSTQLRALMGGVQGVANLSIITPITRIAVIRDSIGFVASDTFTIAALQRTRSYRAIAYDTLDAPMTGVSFIFESSNPSVALADSTGSETVRVRAVANGLTSVRATAQGVSGSASLRVQQQLAALDLSPDLVGIAPSGVQLLTVRGLDADGFFLPSVTGVTFTSLQPAIATVNATTGLVTGVSAGTALVTAFRDSIGADTITVTVGEGVPAVISFGRDSLAIGRSGSQSIPIYLSRPSTSPVTVLLAVADTFANFSTASVVINAGSTSGNATLNGRSAGLTTISALDGSTVPTYAGDTALLAVQANVRFTTTSYSLVATNSLTTQLLLSDPAPPGGSYIAYQYGTPGRVEISPDPAFIPAGQLSANVVITALSAGGTTVTPVTVGATGQTATVNTFPALLDLSGTLYRLGTGQQRSDIYVATQSTLTQGITVSLMSSDTSIVQVPPSVTIDAGGSFRYFSFQASNVNRGRATIYATAPGFTTDSATIEVNTPRVGVCCNNANVQTTSPAIGFTVSVRDSLGSQYARNTPLVVSLATSDPSIITLGSGTVTIPAGSGSVSGASYTPAGGTGSARIYVSAPGHATDSITITVTGPKLSFSGAGYRVGAGQRNASSYVQVPNNTTSPLIVSFSSAAGNIVSLPDTVTIPAGTSFRYYPFEGLQVGSDTIFASAPGHQPDTAIVIVSTPRLGMTNLGTYDNLRPPFNIQVAARDSVNSNYDVVDTLVVTLTSSDTTVARVSPTALILPGTNISNTPQITIVGINPTTGDSTAIITATAPGYTPIVDTLTVRTPKLSFNYSLTSPYRIGARQRSGLSSIYVQVPNTPSDTLPVTITSTNPGIDSIMSSPSIPPTTSFRYFELAGLTVGTDTLIASAPGHIPDTMIVVVNSPRFNIGTIATPRTTTDPPRTFTVTSADSTGGSRATLDPITVNVTSSNPAVMQVTSPTYTIPAGQQLVQPQVSFVGPGTAFITVSDSAGNYLGGQTNTVTVTGPSLNIVNNTSTLGMRQHNGNFGAYVSVPNNIVGDTLTVFLTSSDPSVASVPPTVRIPTGQSLVYFRVTSHDVIGTVQITATAAGYAPDNMTQQVTAPRFLIFAPGSMRTTQTPGTITVVAADAGGTEHPVTDTVVVTLASSDASVASVDSVSVTILPNASRNNTARVRPHNVGTIQLSATDDRTEPWRYATATTNLSVTTPQLTLDWASLRIGVGQYRDVSVSVPDNNRARLLVSLARQTSTSLVADTVTIDSLSFSRTFRLTGVSLGLDSIRASTAGHNPDSAAVSVELGNITGILNLPATLSSDSVLVTLRTKDPSGTVRNVVAATTFNLAVDASLQFTGLDNTPISSVTVPADASSVAFYVKRLSAGTAIISITNPNYEPFAFVVTVNAP